MFVDTKVKIRNPEIRYSLGEETEAENKDEDMLEELYLERKVEKLESERQVESTKDGILEDKGRIFFISVNIPPLVNICFHMYEPYKGIHEIKYRTDTIF